MNKSNLFPKYPIRVAGEMFVFGNNGQIFDQTLRDDYPVKGIAMVQIKCRYLD